MLFVENFYNMVEKKCLN